MAACQCGAGSGDHTQPRTCSIGDALNSSVADDFEGRTSGAFFLREAIVSDPTDWQWTLWEQRPDLTWSLLATHRRERLREFAEAAKRTMTAEEVIADPVLNSFADFTGISIYEIASWENAVPYDLLILPPGETP
jgi:hypothetical protein